MFAIQVAKAAGAHVTAVDNAGKLDHMRALGADEVLDYRRDDFTRQEPYDLVLDLVAHRSVRDYRRALAPGGRYRCVGGPGPHGAERPRRRCGRGPAQRSPDRRPRGETRPGALRPARRAVRDRRGHHPRRPHLPLEEVPEALAHVGEGRALGKVVVVPG